MFEGQQIIESPKDAIKSPKISSTLSSQQQMKHLISKIISHVYLTTINTNKHVKIRLNAWIAKLQSIISNPLWRKNRNNYLRLLYVMLECGHLMQPFIAMPPDQVPTLHRHQINCTLMNLDRKVKEAINMGKFGKQSQQILKNNVAIIHAYGNVEQFYNMLESKVNFNLPSQQKTNKKNGSERKDIKMNEQRQSSWLTDQVDRMSVLSPISNISTTPKNTINPRIPHGRTRSQFTDLTSDNSKNNMVISSPINQEDSKKMVRYFSKNRINTFQNEENYSKDLNIRQKTLLSQIYGFLEKNNQIFIKDPQFSQIRAQLTKIFGLRDDQSENKENKNKINNVRHSLFRKQVGLTLMTKKKPQNIVEQNVKNEFNEQLIAVDEKNPNNDEIEEGDEGDYDENVSYNYQNGKFSEYSSIQVDQGISASKMKNFRNATESNNSEIDDEEQGSWNFTRTRIQFYN